MQQLSAWARDAGGSPGRGIACANCTCIINDGRGASRACYGPWQLGRGWHWTLHAGPDRGGEVLSCPAGDGGTPSDAFMTSDACGIAADLVSSARWRGIQNATPRVSTHVRALSKSL